MKHNNFKKAVGISILGVITMFGALAIIMSREVGHQTAETIEKQMVVVDREYAEWDALRRSLEYNELSKVKLGAYFEATTNMQARLTGVMTPTGALERAKFSCKGPLADLAGSLARYSRQEAEWADIVSKAEDVQMCRKTFKAEVDKYLGSEALQVWGALY